jgi:hypothetical protein
MLPPPFLTADAGPWLALAVVSAFLCGLRPFAVATSLALAGWQGWVELPAGLPLASGLALAVCALLAVAERWADARALSGHPEDLLLSALRVPCGAVVLGAVCVDHFGAWGWLALPLGAALALSGQALKAALRSLGTLLGWRLTLVLVALLIDLAVPGLLVLAWTAPVMALAALSLLLAVALPLAVWWVRELRSRWRRWALIASALSARRG